MKKLLILLSICMCVSTAFAQNQPEVPDYTFETREDFSKYNDRVLECCKWLLTVHPATHQKLRPQVQKFILDWSMGSPDVSIVFDDKILPYVETHGTLISWHMAGSIIYQLERGIYAKKREDIIASSLAGIDAVIVYYQTYRDYFHKSKEIEKLAKLRDKGKLEKYVADRIIMGIPEEELQKAENKHGQ